MTLRRRISKSEISQSFDLKKLLDQDKVSKEQKDLFYDLVVDKMLDRTLSGEDVNGSRFKQYSEKYADFKGVSRNSVDMTLKGDMLDAIKKDIKGNRVRIVIDDSDEVLKSFNHLTGDTLPKRDFFGFKNEDDLDDIVREVKRLAQDDEQPQQQPQQQPETERVDLAELRAAVQSVFIDIGDVDGN